MKTGIFIRIFVCILALGGVLYSYISKQNAIVKLRLAIPIVMNELKVIQEENTKLQFEIDQFENPVHLMELARKPEYSHLKYPLLNEIVTITNSNEHD